VFGENLKKDGTMVAMERKNVNAIKKWIEENNEAVEAMMKGEMTSLTNLGAYRAYMVEYLVHHRNIDARLPVMVRDMPPTESGMPVELYCFSKINSWVPYEGVQSEVLDFAYAVVSHFGLKLYQTPAGSDIESLRKKGNSKLQI